ncbi:MAG: thioredoxin peroxidase [Anaerolineaceae bacterium]|nr:thioredoxin peroxidase [Anaerolineaceae bacterium]
MAQLRQDYEKFTELGAEILTLGPDGPRAFKRYWEENDIPYIGLADIKSKIADSFSQEVNLFKLGRMPALFVIDKEGIIRYAHYGDSMSDIPENSEVLEVIKQIKSD